MKCKDCACYKDKWCTMVTDSPDPDMERDCAHFIREQRWIPVTERLPEAELEVLACCKIEKREYVCNAFFEPKGTFKGESDYNWDFECCDNYDEEHDDYEITPGWYERVHNWDDYGCVKIQDEVTHWMPLPEPPESEGERKNKKCKLRPMACDWALDIQMGDTTVVLYFNSRNNAEQVKAILEWEDGHPNEAVPYPGIAAAMAEQWGRLL